MVAPTIFRQGQMAVPILRQLGFPTSVTNSSHKKSSNGSLKDNLLEQPVISKMVLTDRLPAFCGMQFDFLGFSMFFLHEIPSFLGTRPGSYFSIRTVSLFLSNHQCFLFRQVIHAYPFLPRQRLSSRTSVEQIFL